MNGAGHAIELDSVSKTFPGGTRAVREVSLRVGGGQILVLLGSSGCGKTTTLRMINRMIEPTGGRVLVGGMDVRERPVLELRRSMGYVFQDIGLFPHMSAGENAGVVLRLLGWDRRRRRARAAEMLERVGLGGDGFYRRMPAKLSGGQQQRVGIARALAADPGYLLMDEPFGALDAITREQLQDELVRLQRETPRTVVFVTHDLFEAVRLGDRIAVMHEGRVEQAGAARELMSEPGTGFVRELFGRAKDQAEMLLGAHA